MVKTTRVVSPAFAVMLLLTFAVRRRRYPFGPSMRVKRRSGKDSFRKIALALIYYCSVKRRPAMITHKLGNFFYAAFCSSVIRKEPIVLK